MNDLDMGAFSDDGPWELAYGQISWHAGIEVLRTRTNAEVPELVRRRLVPPVRRLLYSAVLLLAAVGGWFIFERRRGDELSRAGLSRRLRKAFERLGPTYIKLGQIISSGEGIFPAELVGEFRTLRDKVPPEPFDTVREVVEAELGRPLESTFSSFERTPLAAASIAQVHAATLITGEKVVVKVQRPNVAATVRRDLRAMSWGAPLLVGRIPVAALANPPALVEVFAETIVEELDFRLEAGNMLDIARVLAETDQRAIVVPRPHPSLVTRRLLVMERLDGFPIDDVEGMKAAGIDTSAVVRALMIGLFEGSMLFGVFHGDYHGGNLVVRHDGRVALFDYGMTGRLSEHRRLAFLALLMCGVVNDVRGMVGAFRDLGGLAPDVDVERLVRELDLDQPMVDPTTMSADELTARLKDFTRSLLTSGAKLPKELMLLVKDLLFLDGAMATLAPDVDLLGEISTLAEYFNEKHGERITGEVGVSLADMDLDALMASAGFDAEQLTYRDLQARRKTIQEKLGAGAEADSGR